MVKVVHGVCINFGAGQFKNGRLTDFKMATVAILNLLPVSIFIIWSSLDSG